jgi:hypothetical protein
VLPTFAVVSLILAFTIRNHETLLIILPALAAVPTLSLLNGLAGDYLPLSVPPEVGRQGATHLTFMMVGALVSGAISGVAMAALRFGWFWPLLAGEIVVLAAVHAVLLTGIRARPLAPLE